MSGSIAHNDLHEMKMDQPCISLICKDSKSLQSGLIDCVCMQVRVCESETNWDGLANQTIWNMTLINALLLCVYQLQIAVIPLPHIHGRYDYQMIATCKAVYSSHVFSRGYLMSLFSFSFSTFTTSGRHLSICLYARLTLSMFHSGHIGMHLVLYMAVVKQVYNQHTLCSCSVQYMQPPSKLGSLGPSTVYCSHFPGQPP